MPAHPKGFYNERVVASILGEYRRYKKLTEGAVAQLSDDELLTAPANSGNAIAVLVHHLTGNLASRFTDFLATDGEKPWREREGEFLDPKTTRDKLLQRWNESWDVLFRNVEPLTNEDLAKNVTIRGQSLTVIGALHRSLSHTSYHVGQIVMLARSARGDEWTYLSIPPGQTEAYNENPTLEKGPR